MEYEVHTTVSLSLYIDVEANNKTAAKEKAMQYLDNSANYESDYFRNIVVTDIEIEDINEA